jgi:hypothetical protein
VLLFSYFHCLCFLVTYSSTSLALPNLWRHPGLPFCAAISGRYQASRGNSGEGLPFGMRLVWGFHSKGWTAWVRLLGTLESVWVCWAGPPLRSLQAALSWDRGKLPATSCAGRELGALVGFPLLLVLCLCSLSALHPESQHCPECFLWAPGTEGSEESLASKPRERPSFFLDSEKPVWY